MGNRDIRRSVEGRGMGRGTWGIQDGHYMDFQERKQGIARRRVWGGLTRVEKIEDLDGVVNSCFEGLEGRMGLNRVREFIPKAGKKRNKRVKVSSDS